MTDRSKHLRIASLLCVIMAAFILIMGFACGSAYADTQSPVKYVDENGTEYQINEYTVLKGGEKEIGSSEVSWYVVNSNISFSDNIKVKDGATVNLVLCDGAKMTCKDNFTVNESSALKIWGQSATGGELTSTGGYFSGYAAIGGETGHTNGLIEIHSSSVTARLDGATYLHKGAAIGAGNGANGGQIRIFGGKIYVRNKGAGTGIGGGHTGNSGDIQISGGDLQVISAAYGAGIGAGAFAGDNKEGKIEVSGGKLNVSAVNGGAGIGGGEETAGGLINITGGTIEAGAGDGPYTDSGAAIGGGDAAYAGIINIRGGDVKAHSGVTGGTAIGCGEECEGEITGEIEITGGTVEAIAGKSSESAGIGGANGSNGCHVVIRGGKVTAKGNSSFAAVYNSNGGAGIGGGDDGNGGVVEIYGGTVDATGGADAAGIGGGDHGSGGRIIIAGGDVTANGYICGAGIGGGEARTGGNIIISGGTVNATGGAHASWSGAGIGGGDGASGTAGSEKIQISGGDITATGGNEAAGIGGGDDGGSATVLIDGGNVTANGGKYAAGIGTGQNPADSRAGDGSITINGGHIEAKGGTDGAGIGGGENADGPNITINDGTVNSYGSSYGAGIGGGENCKGGSITINGGTVTAVAGSDCKGSESDGGSAIGSGQGINKGSGSLTLDAAMMVSGGDNRQNAEKAPAAERLTYASMRNYAQVRQCTHEDAATYEKTEEGHKVQGCANCGLDTEGAVKPHVYIDGKCKICGFDQPRNITVTFDAGEHGEGTMEEYKAYSGENYVLPKCGFEPETGYIFYGWKVGDTLVKAGRSISVEKDTTVIADWKSTEGDEWINLRNKIEAGGKITLENDVKAPTDLRDDTYHLDVEKGSVTLDLNGYTLDRNINAPATRGQAIGASDTGSLTLINGQVTGANGSGVTVGGNGSLILKDVTIIDNNGEAVWASANGSLSISGTIKLINNQDGGILLEKDHKININGPLSKNSVIPVKLKDSGEGIIAPTTEAPVVITSGLKGKGDVKCFTSDNKAYTVGEDPNGEAVIGIPATISFESGYGSGKMADDVAVCGNEYTLPECDFIAPANYAFSGWSVSSEEGDKILPAGRKVTFTKDARLKAVFEHAPALVPVKLEVGEGHEEVAQKIAAAFNAGKAEGSEIATADGNTVSIQIAEDMTIAEAEDKICTMMAKAKISYDGEDGKSGNRWTETVGLKPLSGYSSFEEHEEAEMQKWPGHGGDMLKDIEEAKRLFYVHWSQPVTSLEMTIDEPVCGTEITIDEDGKPNATPAVTLTAVEPSSDAIKTPESVWKNNGGKSLVQGTITGGETYDASSYIYPAFGYHIPESIGLKVNGATPDAQGISLSGGTLVLNTDIVAVHALGETPEPVWSWNGYDSATASFICAADESHVTAITDDDIYSEEKEKASCSVQGKINYTAAIEFEGATYTKTITRVTPKTAHEWGEAEYTWYDDNSKVLAKRQCTLDPSHIETEVAETTSSEGSKAATCTEAGTTKYTASFENEAFATQVKEEEKYPALGHDFGEWKETKPASETEEGVETRTCKRCGKTETRDIPPKGHTHKGTHVEAQPATCTEEGCGEYWVCTCGRCFADEAATQEIEKPTIPAKGHDYQVEWKWSADNSSATLSYVCKNDSTHMGSKDAVITVEETATCEKAGKKQYTATVTDGPDGKTYIDVHSEEMPTTGHKWGAWENYDSSRHQRVCANDASHTEIQDHVWDEGRVIAEPTMTSEGIMKYTCETCRATRTEAIPKIIPDEPIALTEDMITLSPESFKYNGKAQKPEVQVSYDGKAIASDYYTVSYSDENSTEVGTYTVTVQMKNGRGYSTDPCEKTYTITKEAVKPFTAKMVSLSAASYVYNGRVLRPSVKVTSEGKAVSADKYTVTYSNKNSVNAGIYTVTVKMKAGQGFATNALKKTYTIKKAANTLKIKGKITKVKFKKLRKKALTLKATKVIKFTNKGQGTKKYTLVSVKKGKKNFKKRFKINAKTGKVTVKKKVKKGLYKVKVKVRAAGDANHNASAVKIVTIKVRVR